MENNRLGDFWKEVENGRGIFRTENDCVNVRKVNATNLMIIKGVANINEASFVTILKPRFVESDDIGAAGNIEDHAFIIA